MFKKSCDGLDSKSVRHHFSGVVEANQTRKRRNSVQLLGSQVTFMMIYICLNEIMKENVSVNRCLNEARRLKKEGERFEGDSGACVGGHG